MAQNTVKNIREGNSKSKITNSKQAPMTNPAHKRFFRLYKGIFLILFVCGTKQDKTLGVNNVKRGLGLEFSSLNLFGIWSGTPRRGRTSIGCFEFVISLYVSSCFT